MTIHVNDLKFSCIIGILEFERVQEQTVIIDLTLQYDYKNNYIDYALLVQLIQKHMILNKFTLLENAVLSLVDMIKTEFINSKKLYIKITKPSIMPNCTVGISYSKIFS